MSEAEQLPIHGYRMDPMTPLNQLRERRMQSNRDLKVIITSRNSTTGTGKSTLAAWLCLNWDPMWNAEERATLSVSEYLKTYPNLPSGSCLLMDEAEQLDARRAMSNQNVDFAEKWMMMRVRNVTSVLTLPTASALDKRLKELADIRINVIRRGLARVYKITVDDHNTSQVREWRMHDIEWPDISTHPEMKILDKKKEEKIDNAVKEVEEAETPVDPDEVERQTKIRLAQHMRERGLTLDEIKDNVGMSKGWVSNNTHAPEDD